MQSLHHLLTPFTLSHTLFAILFCAIPIVLYLSVFLVSSVCFRGAWRHIINLVHRS